MDDKLKAVEAIAAKLAAAAACGEELVLRGRYEAVCRDEDGVELWREEFDNLVVTVGQNFLLTEALTGISYTVTGPFMGLISSTSFSAIAATDTMSSHPGWLESGGANAPTMSSTRQTCVWATASGGAIALSSGLSFTFTGSGTVQGAFIVTGSGAVNTVGSSAGTLFSAGTFGTPQPVISGNTLTVSYSLTL